MGDHPRNNRRSGPGWDAGHGGSGRMRPALAPNPPAQGPGSGTETLIPKMLLTTRWPSKAPPGVSVELHQGHTASSLDGIRTRGGFS